MKNKCVPSVLQRSHLSHPELAPIAPIEVGKPSVVCSKCSKIIGIYLAIKSASSIFFWNNSDIAKQIRRNLSIVL